MSVVGGQAANSGSAADDFVARIAAGDRAAEAEFVRRFERGVRALVRRHCRPGDSIVEDLVQETLARVLERLRAGALRDAEALPGYVQSTIAHLTSAEYRNRRGSEPLAAAERLAGGVDPAEHADANQLAAAIRRLLEELPVARDRDVLRSFYLDEQDRSTVCGRLGIDEQHFHRVIFRARQRFRELLDASGIAGSPR
jgi:RNA polymerase sigma-70 factor (ECF subfamily)